MSNGQHYKCFFKSNVLNDGDFDRDNDSIVLIKSVQEVSVDTREGKQVLLCAFLDGYEKPFRINATIAKNISKALKSPIITYWCNKWIAVYIQKGLKAFGDIHDVPRVRPVAPRAPQAIPNANADQIKYLEANLSKENMVSFLKNQGVSNLSQVKADKAQNAINYMNKKGAK